MDPLDDALRQIRDVRRDLATTNVDVARIDARLEAAEADITSGLAAQAHMEGRIEEAHRLIAVLSERVAPWIKVNWAVALAVIAATVGGVVTVITGALTGSGGTP
jgi:hypothetical protein